MSEQSAPSNIDKLLYLKHVAQQARHGTSYDRDINTLIGCIDSDPTRAERHVRLLLRGISETSGDLRPIAYPISRVEIFGDAHTSAAQGRLHDQGLVLFDIHDKPVVHVFNALIGYNGDGVSLTRAILSELAIPDHIFHEIQRKFWDIRNSGTPYYVVIQSTKRDDGLLDWHWASIERPGVS